MARTRNNTPSNRLIPVGNLNPVDFAPFGQVIQNPSAHNGEPKAVQSVKANQGSATKWVDVTDMRSWYERGRSKRLARVVMNMFVCEPRKLRKLDEGEGGGKEVFDVRILERHPFTPQTFVPMAVDKADKESCYIVIVAPTLPARSWGDNDRIKPYPTPEPRPKRSLKERLLGARPNPFTNDYAPSTTPSKSVDGTSSWPRGPGPPDLANIRAFIARGDQAVTYGAGTWHAPMVVLGSRPIEFVVVQYSNGVTEEDVQEVEISAEEGLAVDLTNVLQGDEALKAKL